MFDVPLTKNDTVPYPITLKYKACVIKLLPASEGTGLKAGSSIRSVLELAGYSNILSKMVGSNNKLNNALATIRALSAYKHADHFASLKVAKAEELDSESQNEEKVEVAVQETPKKEEVKKSITKKVVEKKVDESVEKKKAPAKKSPVKKSTEEKKAPAKKEKE